MLIVNNLKRKFLGEKVSENIKYDTIVKTYSSCSKIYEQVWCHIPRL